MKIKTLKAKLKLESYELLCPKCNGKGIITTNKCDGNGNLFSYECPKCKGKRIIDWIENITGVKFSYPTNPIIGSMMYDSNDNSLKIYTGKQWQIVK